MRANYTIQEVRTRKLYEGLRDLWCRVFGDEPEYVDALYKVCGVGSPGAVCAEGCENDLESLPEIMGFVVAADSGKVVSALTCYRCGSYCDPAHDICSGHEDGPGCGLDGLPVYVSYAICTDPEYRGLGLAGELTSYVRDLVLSHGCISILSPAEESLEKFYENLGYRRFFTVQDRVAYPASAPGDDELAMLAGIFGSDDEDFSDDELDFRESGSYDSFNADGSSNSFLPDMDAGNGTQTLNGKVYEWGEDEAGEIDEFAPELSIEPVDAAMYNKYREAFLADVPHVAMSGHMMELVRMSGADGNGLWVINGGDAICAVEQFPKHVTGINIEMPDTSDGNEEGMPGIDDKEAGMLILTELLINPMLAEFSLEIDEEIAARLAEQYGARETRYRMPGAGRCQSMAAFPAAAIGSRDNEAGRDPNAVPAASCLVPNFDPEECGAGSTDFPYFGFPIE